MKFETFEDAHTALDNRPLTEGQANGIRDYVEHNIIPAFDPCLGCEPNAIRSLITELQVLERDLEAEVVPEVVVEKPKTAPRKRAAKKVE